MQLKDIFGSAVNIFMVKIQILFIKIQILEYIFRQHTYITLIMRQKINAINFVNVKVQIVEVERQKKKIPSEETNFIS